MGFVKLPNDLDQFDWFTDKNTLMVYIWLFLNASWCDKRYNGVDLSRGQVAATYPMISKFCDVTPRQARTIIKRLKTADRIAVETTSQFNIITVLDYDGDSKNVSRNVSQMSVLHY